MPTPDESMLNPMTDLFETEEEKAKRLELEQKMKDMLTKLTDKVGKQEAP